MKRNLLVLLCCVMIMPVFGQKIIQGVLKDSATLNPIGYASVTNIVTNKTVITNDKGIFNILVDEDDILTFSAVGYHFDTLHYNFRYANQSQLVLILNPLVANLGNVTVKTKGYSQYQLDSMQRRKEFLADVGTTKIPAISGANSGAGIALNLDRFKKKEKKKRDAYEFFDTNEMQEYINYRFPPSFVHQYTGLEADSLQLFMEKYRPEFKWLRTHGTEEDLKYYINDCLKDFHKEPTPAGSN